MFQSLKTAGVGPVGTMELPERQGRKGRGRCHEGTLAVAGRERTGLLLWGATVGCSNVTLLHFIWRYTYSKKTLPSHPGEQSFSWSWTTKFDMQKRKGYTPWFRKYSEPRAVLRVLNSCWSALCTMRPCKAPLHEFSHVFLGFWASMSPGGHLSDPSFIGLAQHKCILLMGPEACQHCNSKRISVCSCWKLDLFTHHSSSAPFLCVSSLGSTDTPLPLGGWFSPFSLHWFCFSAGFAWCRSILLFLSVQAMHSPPILANSFADQCN